MTNVLDRDFVHAFCRHTHVASSGAETGLLAGLTFGLKDIYDVAGYRTGFGSPDWLATHEPARYTASVATHLIDAGANLVGKTHTEELAFSLTGENAHYGAPLNVAAPGRVPGGSSSGSAAAVAAGLVDFAIGSDTGGSVRGPASFCGIYGIRTTHGRIAMDGACPLAPIFDTCGWFAQSASMMARVGDVLLGGRAATPGRVLIATDAFAYAEADVVTALADGIERIQSLLGRARSVQVSREGLGAWFDVFRVLQYDEIWKSHGAWITRAQPAFGAQVASRIEAVKRNDPAQVSPMIAARADIRAQLTDLLDGNSVLLVPTMPGVAPLLGASPQDTVTFRERALGLLCIAGLGGLPQLNLPFGMLNELPVGLSIIAAPGNDEMLLAIAEELESQR